MSLLNDLLNDLAKQKSSKYLVPFLVAAPSRRQRNKVLPKVLIAGLLLCSCILVIYFTRPSLKAPEPALKIQELTRLKAKVEKEAAELIAPTVTPTLLTSYLPPLPLFKSSKSELVAVSDSSARQNGFSDWVETNGEPTAALVNKVYAPQTLAEWHDAQMNKALKAMEDGLDEEAIGILQAILVKIPNASNARENLASLFLTYGDFASATEVVNEGLEHAPADIPLITIKARLILEQGKSEDALKLLSNHHPSMASYPDFYSTLAAALQLEGRIREAGSLYKALIQIDQSNGQYWLGYAISLEHNHEATQAIEAYIRASQSPESESEVRSYAENRLKTLQG